MELSARASRVVGTAGAALAVVGAVVAVAYSPALGISLAGIGAVVTFVVYRMSVRALRRAREKHRLAVERLIPRQGDGR